ncbi:MAG: hypothetical protein V1702_00290 [Candidatus Woesearchaeota archaeon]
MINENWVILGAILQLIGILSYFIAMQKGKVKPNRVTWFLWALAPLIAFFAEIKQGVGLLALMTFMVGAGPLFIFSASFFNKNSAWKITRFDIICGALSIAGLILWIVTRVGNLAILFSILADGLAALPTVRKAYLYPETEDYQVYFFGDISAVITLLAINTWTFAYFGFPAYIVIINTLMVVLIKFWHVRTSPA